VDHLADRRGPAYLAVTGLERRAEMMASCLKSS
jgi:hypothetical protein